MKDIKECFEILELKPGVSIEEVKEAYRDLVKVWDPDRFSDNLKLQSKAQEKLREINNAYQQIQDFFINLNSYQQVTESEKAEHSETYDPSKKDLEQLVNQSTHLKEKQENNNSLHDTTKEPTKGLGEEQSSFSKDYQKARPWVRYWARMLDLMLLGFPAGIIFGLLFPAFFARLTNAGGPFLLGIFCLPFVLVIEAALIAIFDTTPAKAILNTKITNSDGKPLSFAEALKRCFYIYFVGYAVGIPLISLGTFYWQYKKLVNHGKASWDAKYNFSVSHSKIGGVRITAYIVLFLICCALVANANKKNYSPYEASLETSTPSPTVTPEPEPTPSPTPTNNYSTYSPPPADNYSTPAPPPVPSTPSQPRQYEPAGPQFYSELTRLVPDWKALNKDPDFLDWLKQTDAYSQKTRNEEMLEAYRRNNVESVAYYFVRYKKESRLRNWNVQRR